MTIDLGPTWISSIATVILVIITGKYVLLVKAQSYEMANQSRVMAESIKRDQITTEYVRITKEMDNLVGPLYSKMDDSTSGYFDVVTHSSEGSQFYQDIFAFWRDIKKNVYLAPRDLKESLNTYLIARQTRRNVLRGTGGPYTAEEREIMGTKFHDAIADLKPKIKDRYTELSNLLEECEKELSKR